MSNSKFWMTPVEQYHHLLKEMNDFGMEALSSDELEAMGRYCLLNGSEETANFYHAEVDRRFSLAKATTRISDLKFFCKTAFAESGIPPANNRERRAVKETESIKRVLKNIGMKAGNKSTALERERTPF